MVQKRKLACQRPNRQQPTRGVSLVEALVALAVMSFGMLALVGVQATMRFNSDVARQRTEASRIASEDLEKTRLFATLAPQANQLRPSWQELVATPQALTVALPGDTGNTSFVLSRTVNLRDDLEAPSLRISAASMKVVETAVRWTDRTGTSLNQDATLNTIVTRVAPVLSAALSLPAVGSAPNQQGGRHVSIPVLARDLGTGSSAFKPFENSSNIVWVLNNATGYVTSVCTAVVATQNAITTADLSSCTTVTGRLVTGKVRFDLRTTSVDASVSETPAGPALPLNSSTPLVFFSDADNAPVDQAAAPSCMADVPASPALAALRTDTDYACLVFPSATTGWGGKLDLVAGDYPDSTPGSWQIGSGAADFRVCRYTLPNARKTDESDADYAARAHFTSNANHPKTYCRVSSNLCSLRVTDNLSNQNFLVIRATNSCPVDAALRPTIGDLVNSNTMPHQP